MSDRCYVDLTCRTEDASRFEGLGFKVSDKGSIPGTVVMVDYEADYGHSDELPRAIPYCGWHGAGANYGPQAFACDGKEYAEAETMHDGSLAICISRKGRLDKRMLKWAREYQALLKQVKEALKKKGPTGRRTKDG